MKVIKKNLTIKRCSTHWTVDGPASGHTPVSWLVESGDNVLEEGATEIDFSILDPQKRYPLFVGSKGDRGITVDDLQNKFFMDSVDSGKEIGLHGGRGEKMATAEEISDIDGGRLDCVFTEKGTNRKMFGSWDGKSDDSVSDFYEANGTEYDLPYTTFYGLTHCKATPEFVKEAKITLPLHYYPSIESGAVKCRLNGKCIETPDIFFKSFRKKHKECDTSNTYQEIEMTVKGKNNISYTATAYCVCITKMKKYPDFIDYVPEIFKNEDGTLNFRGGIGFMDDDFMYSLPNGNLIGFLKKSVKRAKPYPVLDDDVLIVVKMNRDFYKNNSNWDVNKLNGLHSMDKLKSLYLLYDKIYTVISSDLRQGISVTSEDEKEEDDKIYEALKPNVTINFDFGAKCGDISFDTDSLVISIPKNVMEKKGWTREGISLYSDLMLTISKKVSDKWFDVVKNSCGRSFVKKATPRINSYLTGTKKVKKTTKVQTLKKKP